MALAGEVRRHLERLPVAGQQRFHIGVGHRVDPAHQSTEILGEHGGADSPQHRGRVVADVPHPVHRIAQQGDPRAPQRRDRLGGPGPVLEAALELPRAPVTRDHRERDAGTHKRVRLILRAMDALVVGQIGHVPRRGDRTLGLDVGQQQRHRRVHQGTDRAQRRPVREHHDRDPVDPAGHELLGHGVDVLPVASGAAEFDLGDG